MVTAADTKAHDELLAEMVELNLLAPLEREHARLSRLLGAGVTTEVADGAMRLVEACRDAGVAISRSKNRIALNQLARYWAPLASDAERPSSALRTFDPSWTTSDSAQRMRAEAMLPKYRSTEIGI